MELGVEATRPDFSDFGIRLPLAGSRITPERCGWTPRNETSERTAPRRPFTRRPRASLPEAQELDLQATAIASLETSLRVIQAHIVGEALRRRLWRLLGSSRLRDYAAERMGMSPRTLQEDARVVAALASLPLIDAAYRSGVIRWTHARLLAGIATAQTEKGWLQVALGSSTRRLAELVKGARPGDRAPGDAADPDACASSPEGTDTRNAADGAAAPDQGPDACASRDRPAIETITEDDDRLVRWTIVATRGGRKLLRVVCELASRILGVDVGPAQVVEAVAAEASSWPFCDPPSPPAPPRRSAGQHRSDTFRAVFEARHGTAEGFRWLEPPPPQQQVEPELARLAEGLGDADPDDIDRRLRRIRAAMQRIDAQLGEVLRTIADRKAHQRLGFADLRLYAEARLGICGSKAMALVKLDRECAQKSPLLIGAYREGRIGWLAATELLPVISPAYEKEWIARAEIVTLRHLHDQVQWALDRADDDGGSRLQPPPPLDLDVTADTFARVDEAQVQLRAQQTADLDSFSRRVDAPITIVMPAGVASLLENVIDGCRRSVEPRWRGFERILAHAYLTWTSLPQHESPIFARDNFRCQVPGCSRRGPLHRHHVWFRSHGGPDWGWNLVCVCDEHHRDFIHLGRIRVEGCAPDGLVWELGCLPGKLPLMRLRGEVYLRK